MYFDAVRSKAGKILFNGTPEATREFLLFHCDYSYSKSWDVVPGRTLQTLSVAEFLAGNMGTTL